MTEGHRKFMQYLEDFSICVAVFLFTVFISTSQIFFYCLHWLRTKLTAAVFPNTDHTPLTSEDASTAWEFLSNNTVINIIALAKHPLSAEDMKDLTLNKVINASDMKGKPLFPKMTRRLTLRAGYLVWSEDSNFNIDDHVKEFRGQHPRDDDELKLLINQLCNIPLHPGKPFWEIVVIPMEYTQNDSPMSCLLFRIHHAMADGISIFRMIVQQMAGNHGEYQHILKRMTNKFKSNIKSSFMTVLLNFNRKLYKSAISSMRSLKQMHVIDRHLSGTYIFDWISDIKMSTIEDIRHQTSATMNDVVTSCLAGALGRHFQRQDLSPPPYSIPCVIPVSFHSPSDPIEMTNKIIAANLELITGDMDCLQRLNATKATMDRMKRSLDITAARQTIQLIFNVIPLKLTKWMNHLLWTSVLFSNVPGPTNKASFDGNVIESMFMLAKTRSNKNFGVAVFSYCGTLTVSVTVDTGIVGGRKELRSLLNDFAEEMQHLHHSTMDKPNLAHPSATC